MIEGYVRKEAEVSLAEGLGWRCFEDPARGPGWCRFRKGSVHVWAIKDGWRRARLVHDFYVGHQTWPTLQEALTAGVAP